MFFKKIAYTISKNKNDLLELIMKFNIFGLISLPLGLWHAIRNYILFNQQLGSVLVPGHIWYIGNYSKFSRLLTISFKQLFGEIYCTLPGDYNLFAYIVKGSLFGEFTYSYIDWLAMALKTLNFVLIVLSLIFTISHMFKKDKNTFVLDLLLITWLTNIISFYMFNIKYPYLCTMDFRYIVPTAFIGIVFILNGLNNISTKITKEIIEYIINIFCLLCFLMFFLI